MLLHFTARREWMEAAFEQAAGYPSESDSAPASCIETWSWLLALLMHDSLADVDAYLSAATRLASRQGENTLARHLRTVSAASSATVLAHRASMLTGLHPRQRHGDIVIHTEHRFTRDFLPPPAPRITQAMVDLFRLRARASVNAATRIASYLILLTVHPFRDGNGRTARLLYAADTSAANAPAENLLGLAWLHGERNARFHLAAKCARAGDFEMLFALRAEAGQRAGHALREVLHTLHDALGHADTAAIESAARALHARFAHHVRQD